MAMASIVALLLVGAMTVPLFREMAKGIGMILLIGVGLGGALIVFSIILRGTPHEQLSARNSFSDEGTTLKAVTPATVELARPRTSQEWIEHLRQIDWFQFEKVTATIYRELGYTVTRRGGANPDGGIDLIIEKEGQRRAVQCKHWKAQDVGVKEVRELLGALMDAGIPKGTFVTLRGYSAEASQLAEKHGMEIVNQAGLLKLIESTNIGSKPDVLAMLHDRRKFCPKCEAEMVMRTAQRGPRFGRKFWGCSTFPKCAFTMPA